jgi:hypothetical protein
MLTSKTHLEKSQKQTLNNIEIKKIDGFLGKDYQSNIGNTLSMLIKLLESVDDNDKLSKLNQITISDNNGGRIIL